MLNGDMFTAAILIAGIIAGVIQIIMWVMG